METGNKTFHNTAFSRDLSLDAEHIRLSHALVNLRYDGLSAIILSGDKKLIIGSLNIDWTPRKSITDLLRKAELELGRLKLNIKDCKSLHWLISTQKFTFLPEHLYVKGKGRQILENTTRLEQGDRIYTDFWAKESIVEVFALPDALIDWIKSNYHGSTFSHSATALNRLYRYYPKSETFALLHVDEHFAEFFLAQGGSLKFYNLFAFNVEEDLLYMLLFALEQSQILAPEIELKLAGKVIKGEKLYKLLENYVGTLKHIDIPERFSTSPQIGNQEIRRVFKLLGGI